MDQDFFVPKEDIIAKLPDGRAVQVAAKGTPIPRHLAIKQGFINAQGEVQTGEIKAEGLGGQPLPLTSQSFRSQAQGAGPAQVAPSQSQEPGWGQSQETVSTADGGGQVPTDAPQLDADGKSPEGQMLTQGEGLGLVLGDSTKAEAANPVPSVSQVQPDPGGMGSSNVAGVPGPGSFSIIGNTPGGAVIEAGSVQGSMVSADQAVQHPNPVSLVGTTERTTLDAGGDLVTEDVLQPGDAIESGPRTSGGTRPRGASGQFAPRAAGGNASTPKAASSSGKASEGTSGSESTEDGK